MSTAEILEYSKGSLMFITPALMIFLGLIFADVIANSLIRIIKSASKQFRI